MSIDEFLGNHEPFCAVVKAQVSDFVVNEVAEDGTVVHLTSVDLPKPAKSEKRELSDVAVAKPPETAEDWTAAYAALDTQMEAGGTPVSDLIRAYVDNFTVKVDTNGNSADPATTGGELKALVLPSLEDKAARRAVHSWVKTNLPSFVSDTVSSDAGKGCIRLRQKDACRPWKRRRTDDSRDGSKTTQEANADAARDNTYDPRNVGRKGPRGDNSVYVGRRTHVQFVLWKCGKDTIGALDDIAKRLRIRTDDLSHAGTKDKRGITSQRVRVLGIPLQRLAGLNKVYMKYQGRQHMALGNFEIMKGSSNQKLGLGDLAGNRFTLALREISLNDDAAMDNIERAVSSVRERGFVNYFGLQRFGSGTHSTHGVGFSVLRGDFEDVCHKLLTPAVIQEVAEGKGVLREDRRKSDDALRGFAAGTVSAKDLAAALPFWMTVERNLATAYARLDAHGRPRDHKSVFETLPKTLRSMYVHAVQSFMWNMMASIRIQHSKRDHAVAGDLILAEKHDRSLQLSHTTSVRPVTVEEEEAKSVPLENVLLPVVGSKVPLPTSPAGAAGQAVLDKEKLDLQNLPTEIRLAGTYRWLIARPTEVSHSIVRYRSREERLLPSTVSDVLKSSATTGTSFQRAADDSKVDVNVGAPATSQGICSLEKADVVGSDAKRPFSALVLSFTLGTSEYATMLIRELTRQESSAANQKAQQEEALRGSRLPSTAEAAATKETATAPEAVKSEKAVFEGKVAV